MEKKFNCYECKFRRSIAGDAHTRCAHPNVGGDETDALMAMIGIKNNSSVLAQHSLNIVGHQHGIKSGWFMWPYNFDPTWLLNCDGFEKKGVE